MGLSLGGLTSTLLGFHPKWRDNRIGAVVSIAGPTAMLGEDFFSGKLDHIKIITLRDWWS